MIKSAAGGTRTHTRFPSTDFKSVVSTIPPRRRRGNVYMMSGVFTSGKSRKKEIAPAFYVRRWFVFVLLI
jgi:hypothetical protein